MKELSDLFLIDFCDSLQGDSGSGKGFVFQMIPLPGISGLVGAVIQFNDKKYAKIMVTHDKVHMLLGDHMEILHVVSLIGNREQIFDSHLRTDEIVVLICHFS